MKVSAVWSEIDITTLEMQCAFDRFPKLRGLTYRLSTGETARVIGTDCLFPARRILVETDDGRRWSVDAEKLARLNTLQAWEVVTFRQRVQDNQGITGGK